MLCIYLAEDFGEFRQIPRRVPGVEPEGPRRHEVKLLARGAFVFRAVDAR